MPDSIPKSPEIAVAYNMVIADKMTTPCNRVLQAVSIHNTYPGWRTDVDRGLVGIFLLQLLNSDETVLDLIEWK